MRKIFAAIALIFCMSFTACAEVEQDIELHRVVGGLYTLATAVNLNGGVNPSMTTLSKYFGDNATTEWLNDSRLIRQDNAIWVGIPIDKYSSARQYLRSNSQELGIMQEPGGVAWLGGDYAWLKAADIIGKSIKPVALMAAMGSGSDSALVFLKLNDQSQWWQAMPEFGPNSSRMVMAKFGVRNAPELHRPGGAAKSTIYDEVRPSSVGVPGKMHVGRTKSSFDMNIEMGDVIFKPIPNIRR